MIPDLQRHWRALDTDVVGLCGGGVHPGAVPVLPIRPVDSVEE